MRIIARLFQGFWALCVWLVRLVRGNPESEPPLIAEAPQLQPASPVPTRPGLLARFKTWAQTAFRNKPRFEPTGDPVVDQYALMVIERLRGKVQPGLTDEQRKTLAEGAVETAVPKGYDPESDPYAKELKEERTAIAQEVKKLDEAYAGLQKRLQYAAPRLEPPAGLNPAFRIVAVIAFLVLLLPATYDLAFRVTDDPVLAFALGLVFSLGPAWVAVYVLTRDED